VAFPGGLTLVTLSGQIDLWPDGGVASGGAMLKFAFGSPLTGAADQSVVPFISAIAGIDADGSFSISLPATNDPGWVPQDWAYAVKLSIPGVRDLYGSLQLDYADTTQNFADVIQWSGATEDGVTYATLTALTAGLAEKLDTDGGTVSGNLSVLGELRLGADTNLYRVGANRLATDDGLDVGGNLKTYSDLDVDGQITLGNGRLYVENGALKFQGGSGTVTTIAPA